MDQRYTGLLDMLNGGGPQAAGQTFQGGALSELLNSLGIRPMGYQNRMAEAQQQPAMMPMAPRVSTMGAPPRGPGLSPVPDQIQQMMLPRGPGLSPVPDQIRQMMPTTPAPDQIAELLRMLGIDSRQPGVSQALAAMSGGQPYAMSASPRMPAGENYDPMARGAGVFSTGYGPR
jgi:hypothetical protein